MIVTTMISLYSDSNIVLFCMLVTFSVIQFILYMNKILSTVKLLNFRTLENFTVIIQKTEIKFLTIE